MVFEACESVFSGAALVCVNDGAYHIGYCLRFSRRMRWIPMTLQLGLNCAMGKYPVATTIKGSAITSIESRRLSDHFDYQNMVRTSPQWLAKAKAEITKSYQGAAGAVR